MCGAFCALGSNKAIGARDCIFHQWLLRTDGNQLVAGRLGAAVPRLAEKRNPIWGARGQVKLRRGQSRCVRTWPAAILFAAPPRRQSLERFRLVCPLADRRSSKGKPVTAD